MVALATLVHPSRRAWYVIYTRPRWEKKINDALQKHGFTSFCPLRMAKHQWADREKMVAVPLFNSYVFVQIDLRDEFKVRQIAGVLNFVYSMGKIAVVKHEIIEEIRSSLELYPDAEVVDFKHLDVGTRVKITAGIMQQKEGYVLRNQHPHIIVVIDSLNCVLTTKVEAASLKIIN